MGYLILLFICAAIFVSSFFIQRKSGRYNDSSIDENKTKNTRSLVRLVAAVIFFVSTIACSLMIVQPGEVGFRKTFGNLSHKAYGSGPHLVNPFSNGVKMNIQRQAINYSGEYSAVSLSKNRTEIVMDITIPWILNPVGAPMLYERYGKKDWSLLGPASREAIRGCTARLDWEDAVSEEGRVQIANCIPVVMQEAVIADLINAGFSQEDAARTFTLPKANVRKTVPKDSRILASIAEEQAAVVDLRRQETLTSIAAEEALRRANDGSGIKMMMAELPENFTVSEMVAMIEANAMKTNSEAFLKAVEAGNPNISVIISGGTDVPVTASAR